MEEMPPPDCSRQMTSSHSRQSHITGAQGQVVIDTAYIKHNIVVVYYDIMRFYLCRLVNLLKRPL